jgi:hypothetical protein
MVAVCVLVRFCLLERGVRSPQVQVTSPKKNKIRKNRCRRLQTLIFDEFRGFLIDTPNPSIK